MAEVQRRVVCAAMQHPISKRIICGARHHDCMFYTNEEGERHRRQDMDDPDEWEQGFVDQFNKFMTRAEAWEVAKAARQLKPVAMAQRGEGSLTSEDLY